MTREEVAKIIEDFVSGTGGKWDWDDFTAMRLDDPELDAVRHQCFSVRDEFSSTNPHQYCSDAGMQVLRDLATSLRAGRGTST
ncbi:MAG TPA: hypothetical protein VJ252_08685 [Chthoniobacterales bacterium]|nr:hypothetical protein [Chthoniobacterales bacterium]